jgi:hypothetical protein
MLATMARSKKDLSDASYAVSAAEQIADLFGAAPRSYAYDRGGCSTKNIARLRQTGVRHVGLAPRGRVPWQVNGSTRQKLVRERALVEGAIGTIKSAKYGFNRPAARSVSMMGVCGQRAVLGLNLNQARSWRRRKAGDHPRSLGRVDPGHLAQHRDRRAQPAGRIRSSRWYCSSWWPSSPCTFECVSYPQFTCGSGEGGLLIPSAGRTHPPASGRSAPRLGGQGSLPPAEGPLPSARHRQWRRAGQHLGCIISVTARWRRWRPALCFQLIEKLSIRRSRRSRYS